MQYVYMCEAISKTMQRVCKGFAKDIMMRDANSFMEKVEDS